MSYGFCDQDGCLLGLVRAFPSLPARNFIHGPENSQQRIRPVGCYLIGFDLCLIFGR